MSFLKRISALCVFSLALIGNSFSQTIVGRVINAKQAPVAYSSVYLYHLPDSALVASSDADSTGRFRLKGFGIGNYFIKAENMNYLPGYASINVDSAKLYRKQIELGPEVTQFAGGGVKITRTMNQKNDTVEFNASSYKVNPDASAENLVTKMPGVTNENGTIKAQGEEIKKVTVDGQDFYGDDAAAALKNLPAEIVDKIQIYDRASDQSQFTGMDDGNSQKTLNIVTKNGKNNGQFGKIYGGYGTDNRWAAGGNINFFKGKNRLSVVGMSNNINQQNFTSQDITGLTGSTGGGGMMGGPGGGNFRRPGGGGDMNNFLVGQQSGINTTNSLGLNFSSFGMKNLKLTASYFFNNGINNSSSFLNRTYFLTALANQLYSQGDTSKNTSYNHRFNMRLEYTIDSANSIIYTPSFRYQTNQLYSVFDARTKTQEMDTLNSSGSKSNSKANGYTISNNLLLRHRFKLPGHTLSLNLSHTLNSNIGNSDLNSNNQFYEPVYSISAFKQIADNNTNSSNFSPNISYTFPIKKKSTIELNYNPTFNYSKSYKYTQRFDSLTNEYSAVDSLLSSTFNNVSNTHRIGGTYRYKSDKFSFNIGATAQRLTLRSEQTFPRNYTISKPFDNLLPNAMITYQPAKNKNLRVYFRGSTNIPSVSQLQNVINNSNPLILSSGNSSLRQEVSYRAFFRYSSTNVSKGRSFFLFGNASTTADYIANNNVLAQSDTTVQLSETKVNLKKGAQINLPVNLDGYRNFRTFITYGIPVKKIKSTLNFNAGQTITRSPAMINDKINFSNTYNSNAGLVVASNVSERLDFTISYGANYNIVRNSIQSSANSNYLIQNFNFKLNYMPTKHIVFNTDITNSSYSGLGSAYNLSIWLVNGGIGYKFLKDNRGELKLSVFDALKKNNSISRTVTENYIEDKTTQILTRFYMLTFTYSIRNFNANAKKTTTK